jgi:hypothetical protein
LCGCGSVTQVRSQGRGEEREGVDGHQGTVEHEGGDPDFPVEESVLDELHLEFGTAAIVVEGESGLEVFSLGLSQELGSVGVVVEHPEGGNGDDDGEDTLKDEDPSLAVSSDDRGQLLRA